MDHNGKLGEHDWVCRNCEAVVTCAPTDEGKLTRGCFGCPECGEHNWKPSARYKELQQRTERRAKRREDARKIVPSEAGLYWYWHGEEWTVIEIQEDQCGCMLWQEYAAEPETLVEQGAFGPKLVPPSAPPGDE